MTRAPIVQDEIDPGGRDRHVRFLCLLFLGFAVVLGLTGSRWRGEFNGTTIDWSRFVWLLTLGYGAFMYAATAWRVGLWWRYRPMAGVNVGRLPRMSVIIPVFNEGPLSGNAIRAAAASRYPLERLEIIVIDDGSTDDSWAHILSAAREISTRVRVVTLRHHENLGKRRALRLGFRRATGDVFVTVDSDSLLHPDALVNGVAPLVRDARIGCVAGCVEVLNPADSVITRFLKCSFSLSFKFVRAYQNAFRGVFCTPGALSFYRADFVRKVADEWVNQRFMGATCTIGEDRSMTNLFLREGWLTAYQGNAVVRSKMPSTYSGLCRMFLRWARSNLRETVVMFRFLFQPFRAKHLAAFRINMILATAGLVLPPILIANNLLLVAGMDWNVFHQFGILMIYAATASLIYYLNEGDNDWVWLFVYELFWVACLSWIIPYAALTLRKTGWLTRQAAASPMQLSSVS